MTSFKALRTRECDGRFLTELTDVDSVDLSEGLVRIAVQYSSLNYKDALSATGNRGVTRNYPHTLGIDACGEVLESACEQWKPGDHVIVTGYDLGMNCDGGLAEQVVCPGDWLLSRPEGLSAATSMTLGTAGLTAGLCVARLESVLGSVKDKSIVVSGATGGVGSIAVALLAKLGAKVTAVSGKKSQANWLLSLGADTVIPRSEKRALDPKPISKPYHHGAIDTVGGEMLSNLLKVIFPQGAVACCGMASGNRFESSIFPFILRGVSLLGVDSVEIPISDKQLIWSRFEGEWALGADIEGRIATEITLSEAGAMLGEFLKSSVVGRYRVRVA